MPEYISEAAESSDEFDTLIPSLTEISDIVEAFTLYHYGRSGKVLPPAPLSIHGHLNDLSTSLQTVSSTINFLDENYLPFSASAEYITSSIETLNDQYPPLSASATLFESNLSTMNLEYLQIKTVTDSLYTLEIGDVNKVIEMNSASANTVIIPNSASVNFPIGSAINIIRFSSQSTTITPASGVTLLSAENLNVLASQYSATTVYKYSANTWILIGLLS
jgi:hypothetical protein